MMKRFIAATAIALTVVVYFLVFIAPALNIMTPLAWTNW
nr:MAG TPA: protein of unknown function (DUF4969) [Caudoviricetes sp.]